MCQKNVVFWKKRELVISSGILKKMKYRALHNGTDKFRYCFHENEESSIHEMLFTNTRNNYFRPHCHDEDELQIVISGRMYVIFFDDNGNITEKFYASKKENSIYRINKQQWHMNLPLSKTVTIFEVKKGPFHKNSNCYPEWAPDGTKEDEARSYIQKMKMCVLPRRIKHELFNM